MAAEVSTEALIRSHARWRAGLALLAAVMPALCYGLFERQAVRLEALADHGLLITATISKLETRDSRSYLSYAYSFAGRSYDWSIATPPGDWLPGQIVEVLVLPEHPELTRFGNDPASPRHEAENNRNLNAGSCLRCSHSSPSMRCSSR
jgi:hypothetical protein